MSAQTSPSSSISLGALESGLEPVAPSANAAGANLDRSRVAEGAPLSISSGNGLLAKLWVAYRRYRNIRRLRNLPAELDVHLLEDVGAPAWLVNEVTVDRDLRRLRDVDYLRW